MQLYKLIYYNYPNLIHGSKLPCWKHSCRWWRIIYWKFLLFLLSGIIFIASKPEVNYTLHPSISLRGNWYSSWTWIEHQHLSGLNAKPNKVSRGNYQLSFEPNLGIFSTNQSCRRPMWYFPLLWLAVVITVNLILRHSWKVLWNLLEVLV